MNIRVLSVEDATVYRNLRLGALSTNPEAFATTYDDYISRPMEQVASQLAPDDHHYTLGSFDLCDRLVGTVTFVREQAAKVHHIANVVAMYVSPDTRRQGVGRELLAELIKRSKQEHGLEQLRLTVVEDNLAAVSLYRSMGFETYGVEPNAMKAANGSWNEIYMVLALTGQDAFNDSLTAHRFKGFSHVTIDVSDLETSLQFYLETLDLRLVHRGRKDAYLEWGTAWICLQERRELPRQQRQLGVDHVAFYIDPNAFHTVVEALHSANVPVVRGPIERGGGFTINFLDPDGTQLEFHTATLADRMMGWS